MLILVDVPVPQVGPQMFVSRNWSCFSLWLQHLTHSWRGTDCINISHDLVSPCSLLFYAEVSKLSSSGRLFSIALKCSFGFLVQVTTSTMHPVSCPGLLSLLLGVLPSSRPLHPAARETLSANWMMPLLAYEPLTATRALITRS